jgi:hypothetical protein
VNAETRKNAITSTITVPIRARDRCCEPPPGDTRGGGSGFSSSKIPLTVLYRIPSFASSVKGGLQQL